MLGQLHHTGSHTTFRPSWRIGFEDLDLVVNAIDGCPDLAPRTRLYLPHTPVVLDPEQNVKLHSVTGVVIAV